MKIGISRWNDGQAAGRKKLKCAIPAKAGILAVAVFADEKNTSASPPTFVGGETSTAEFTPPRFYRSRKMPGVCSSKLLRLISPPTNVGGEKLFYGQRGRKNKYSSFPAKNPVIPAFAAEFREKNAVIPAKAGIYSGRLILEFPQNDRGKYIPFPRTRESVRIALRCKLPPLCGVDRFPRSREWKVLVRFLRKDSAGNSEINRPEWIPAFAGMTAEAGIRRRESDGGGGDSDLHRNGKSWKLGK